MPIPPPTALIRAAFGVTVDIQPIPWAPGYFVSTDGEAFSTRWWRGEPKAAVRRLKVAPTRDGYGVISLRVNGRTVVAKMHARNAGKICSTVWCQQNHNQASS